jgi:hypothetical protein
MNQTKKEELLQACLNEFFHGIRSKILKVKTQILEIEQCLRDMKADVDKYEGFMCIFEKLVKGETNGNQTTNSDGSN